MLIYHIRSDMVNDHAIEWDGGPGIPSGYTRTVPPEHGPDQHARWKSSGWVIIDEPLPALPSGGGGRNPLDRFATNTISMRQCRLQLLAMDLLDDIDAAVGSMDRAAQIEWEYANDVTRGFPLVVAMQQLLEMTDEDVDQFFTEAAKL